MTCDTWVLKDTEELEQGERGLRGWRTARGVWQSSTVPGGQAAAHRPRSGRGQAWPGSPQPAREGPLVMGRQVWV